MLSSAAFISAESECDQSQALPDAKMERHRDLEGILSEVWCPFDDHSSILRSPHEMSRYDISQALHNYLSLFSDAMRERTMSFHSASTG